MKKLSLLLATAVLPFTLIACGEGEKPKSEAKEPAVSDPMKTQESEKKADPMAAPTHPATPAPADAGTSATAGTPGATISAQPTPGENPPASDTK